MTDHQLAIEAINKAQLILEDYLRPWPQNSESILDRLVEVLDRPGFTEYDCAHRGVLSSHANSPHNNCPRVLFPE